MQIAARTALTGGGGLSAKSYIRDGLVAMWDGIENAGWGKHDANATVWKDLVGSSDGTVSSSNVNWVDLGLNVTGYTLPCLVNIGTPAVSTLCTRYFTVDIAVTPRSTNKRVTLFGNYHQGNFNMEVLYGNGTNNALRLYFGQDYHSTTPFYVANTLSTATCVCNNNNVKGFSNAVQVISGNSFNTPGNYRYVIGCENERPSIVVLGVLNCYRLYNRALTAEEIAHNYAIDAKRFNLNGGGGRKWLIISFSLSDCSSQDWRAAA